jgi:hypothetical protein
MPDRIFHVATLNAIPVGDRWLGEFGEPVQANPNAVRAITMSLERWLTLAA